MNRITQEAKKRQAVVKLAEKKGNTWASRIYGVSLSSVKRWKKRYDGTWKSLKEKSHRPHSHPARHTVKEENLLRDYFAKVFYRYGWDGVYREVRKAGYERSFAGMVYACKRMGLTFEKTKKKVPRKHDRRYPELCKPGELVQIDVKEVPYCCLRGKLRKDGKRLYQWTAIDASTRYRFIYGFEEHTPENTVKFYQMLERKFPFRIHKVQTDNGTEFTYKYISDTKKNPFDELLETKNVQHHLIPPRTPWHNGKVERSHRNDQRYFYDWEHFCSVEDFNDKLSTHLRWSNNKPMRTFGFQSPADMLTLRLSDARLSPLPPPTLTEHGLDNALMVAMG